MRKERKLAVGMVLAGILVCGCDVFNPPAEKSGAKSITAFSFPSLSVSAAINDSAKTISVTVPYGTAVTALSPSITHTGTGISPASGVARDFSNPVTYTVTAEDESTQAYVATVTVRQPDTVTALLKLYDGANPATPASGWAGYELIKANTNLNLSVTFQSTVESEQDSAILALANANNLPDIVEVNRAVWETLVDSGKLAPIDALLSQMPTRSANMYSRSQFRTMATRNGKLYAFPQVTDNIANEGLVIRKDWLDRLGLSVPTNLTELESVVKAFTENDPDGNGVADTYGIAGSAEPNAWREGGLGYRIDFIFGAYGLPGLLDVSSSANFGLTVRNPKFYDAVRYINRLYSSGYIWPDSFTSKKVDFRTFWKTGKVGMMFENHAALHSQGNYDPFNAVCPNGEWISIDPPKGSDGVTSSGCAILCVPRYLAVSQKAIDEGRGPAIAKFLEWMASDAAHLYFLYGTEGVNYTLSGSVLSTAGISGTAYTDASFAANRQLAFLVERFDAIEQKIRYPTYVLGGRTFSAYDTLVAMRAKKNADVGMTTLCATNATVKSALNAGVLAFATGTRPLTATEWAKFIGELDTAGAATWEASMKSELISNGYLQ